MMRATFLCLPSTRIFQWVISRIKIYIKLMYTFHIELYNETYRQVTRLMNKYFFSLIVRFNVILLLLQQPHVEDYIGYWNNVHKTYACMLLKILILRSLLYCTISFQLTTSEYFPGSFVNESILLLISKISKWIVYIFINGNLHFKSCLMLLGKK